MHKGKAIFLDEITMNFFLQFYWVVRYNEKKRFSEHPAKTLLPESENAFLFIFKKRRLFL